MKSSHTELSPLELLHYYKVEDIRPGEDPENILRLSGQGGGMAGIVSLGEMDVLEGEGYIPYFQGIDAISAGTANAVALLTGKISVAKKLYTETLLEGDFINFNRFWKILDLDILHKFVEQHIDPKVIIDHPLDFGIGLTKRKTQQRFAVNSHNMEADELHPYLRSATQLPLAGGWTNDENTDGGTTWPSTPDVSRHFGATHIVDLSNTANCDWKYHRWPAILVDVFNTATSKNLSNLGKFCMFAREQEVIMQAPPPKDTDTIRPLPITKPPTVLTRDKEVLENGFIAGQNGMYARLKSIQDTFGLKVA